MKILQRNLPQVLDALCFNDSNLPFDIEVKNTEMGHLFEHIILEYMCEEKIKNGFPKASFKGVTNWNWKKDIQGTFHIQIEIEPADLEFFEVAFDEDVVAIVFMGTECPVARQYGERLAELDKQYADKGIQFLAVNSNRQDTITELASYARIYHVNFPILKDLNNKVADQLGAARTP